MQKLVVHDLLFFETKAAHRRAEHGMLDYIEERRIEEKV